MKNLRIVLACLLITSGIITFSSFASDNFSSTAFAIVCYKYNGPQPPSPSDIRSTSNYTLTTQQNILTVCDDVPDFCGFCVDNTKLTYQQARELIAAFVEADDDDNFYDVVTTQGQVIVDPQDATKTVTIYLED